MDVTKTVVDYFRANNPVLYFVTDEVYQVQTAIERAAEELTTLRVKSKSPVEVVMLDTVVGLHQRTFATAQTMFGQKASVAAFHSLFSHAEPHLQVSGRQISVASDMVVVIKGWETYLDPRDPASADFAMLISNVLQGNLCSATWLKVPTGQVPDGAAVKVDPDNAAMRLVAVRGRRLLVFVAKHGDIHKSLPEIKPINLPLPGREAFTPMVRKFIKGNSKPTDRLPADFETAVVSGLLGMTTPAADDALMLSVVENNQHLMFPGTVDTLERLRTSAIQAMPGVKYIPMSQIDGDMLPGYEPINEFLDDSVGVDEAFAKSHNIKPIEGLFIGGCPGVGKTVAGMQIVRKLRRPLLMCSIGEMQGGIVGASEYNLRRFIDIARAIGAGAMFDDVDKAGMGSGGSAANDGGVMDRMTNILLTEMSMNDGSVVWIFTGNRMQMVRPELYRDGRCSERFFVDLPDSPIRMPILEYHMKRFNFPLRDFMGLSSGASEEALNDLCSDGNGVKKRTGGWSGAELMNLVQKASRRAVKRQENKLDIRWMIEQASTRVPMSRSKAAAGDLAQMREMCSDFVRVGVSQGGVTLGAAEAQRGDREIEHSEK